MEKENDTEGADLSQINGSDQSADTSNGDQQNNGQQDTGQQSDDQQEDESQDDYRGKLNATNRFLEKEGYEYKDGRWQKKAADTSGQNQANQSQQSAAPALTREEAIVIAKGHSEEELERAKKIAAVEGIGLVAALDTDLFKDWKAKKDKDAKDRAAQLPASRGGKPVVKKSLATPGLSDEDHKALFYDKIGK